MTSQMQHIVLSAHQLTIGYSSKQKQKVIAKGLDFKFSEGKLISLVGANGIGKSTLLRTLSGMQAPLMGEIKINNKNIREFHPLGLARQLSVVLTEPPSSKNLTVMEFISLGRQPHTNWLGALSNIDLKKIQWAMNTTETLELSAQKCFELSDGQMQRVAIARALAQDTPVVILDEPTTHLDLYHRAYVLKLLKNLAQETGKTILFSTHEIDLAIQLSDEMMIMGPQNLEVDTPQNLIKKGSFKKLFPSHIIEFDENIGRFTIR